METNTDKKQNSAPLKSGDIVGILQGYGPNKTVGEARYTFERLDGAQAVIREYNEANPARVYAEQFIDASFIARA